MQKPLKRCLSRKYQNFLSSDWLPDEDAQYFSLQEYYVPIIFQEKKQTPGGVEKKDVTSLPDVMKELIEKKTGSTSLLIEG